MTDNPITKKSVIVSKQSFESSDNYDIIYSNISFLDSLFAQHLEPQDVSRDALRSYWVAYYLEQVNNGGFAQFIQNSGGEPEIDAYVKEGLTAMGAVKHRAHFDKYESPTENLGLFANLGILIGSFFSAKKMMKKMMKIYDSLDTEFYAISEEEDLTELNSRWLRSLPHLVVMSEEQMEEEVKRRAAEIPDREEREAAAREQIPRYMKLIAALCKEAGHDLEDITAGDPTHTYQEQPVLAWHFLTDKGHYYMLDLETKALMFDDSSGELVTEIEASEEEFGPYESFKSILPQ